MLPVCGIPSRHNAARWLLNSHFQESMLVVFHLNECRCLVIPKWILQGCSLLAYWNSQYTSLHSYRTHSKKFSPFSFTNPIHLHRMNWTNHSRLTRGKAQIISTTNKKWKIKTLVKKINTCTCVITITPDYKTKNMNNVICFPILMWFAYFFALHTHTLSSEAGLV